MKTAHQIRQSFLDFFVARKHQLLPSSPLVPENDPTLLFTNAGMVQFKDIFLGQQTTPYQRVVTSQRCLRAGGKHNDLENVGYTARHHTFFEMLGNFSFGDYFKAEAIHYAWEFLQENLQLPAEKLWITVHQEDEEAAQIWLQDIGISPKRLSHLGDKDNFWAMGEIGPCGPCSEIYYDHGETIPGEPPGTTNQGDRYVEIWNLVFTQYNRSATGELMPIPNPSVDTGMGLERIAAVMQGVVNNYDIDLFQTLIKTLKAKIPSHPVTMQSMQVIVDHIRACAFLITDGVMPANEGRGYVLRRIIRRAVRHGHKLDLASPFFCELVAPLVDVMGDAFPELSAAQETIVRTLKQEEERFAHTLTQGLKLVEQLLQQQTEPIIHGDAIFKLYDTYGFPVDLTADLAREHGFQLDLPGFETCMAAQRKRARATGTFHAVDTWETDQTTEFDGYQQWVKTATIQAIYTENGTHCEQLSCGEQASIVLDTTPFYAESGGQVGDRGDLTTQKNRFSVIDTQQKGEAYLHHGQLQQGSLKIGDTITAAIDVEHRRNTMCHHSATHLLHAALRKILGDHVVQKGSLVAADRLRFDFSHPGPLTPDEKQEIEQLVNHQILENTAVVCQTLPLTAAQSSGALSLFGERYAEIVRVLDIGHGFSKELCGGTHVERSGDLGIFKIISETGIAAEVRRIEAVAGQAALQWVEKQQTDLNEVTALLKTDREHVVNKLQQQLKHLQTLGSQMQQVEEKLLDYLTVEILDETIQIADVQIIAKQLYDIQPKQLKLLTERLKSKLPRVALVLAFEQQGKISLVAGISPPLTDKLRADDLVNTVAQQIGGKGGGHAEWAQAGGSNMTALPAALSRVPDWVRQQLNA